MALAVLLCGTARGQAPAYSAASIVNVSDWSGGPFAPNSVLALFGTNLSMSNPASADLSGGGPLPEWLGDVRVYVDDAPAAMLYASATQINFLIPADEIAGDVKVRIARQGVSQPAVTITLVDGAPALFLSTAAGYALATHEHPEDGILSPDSPAHAGETIVIWAIGLGRTQPNFDVRNGIPPAAAWIEALSNLKVLLNGSPVDARLIKYAGLTPGSAGLYQINLVIPGGLDADPEIRVAIGSQTSTAGLKLAIR
jgi:uncharacterized protein (TIGR03437 family)